VPRTPFPCALACGLLVLLAACGPSPRPAYPPTGEIARAPLARRDFVDSFLQGRWCEAESLYAASRESYLRQDDFCGAAYNALLLWRLKAYVGIEYPAALEEASRLRELGFGCAGTAALADPSRPDDPGQAGLPARDRELGALLAEGRLKELARRLAGEEDPLYASVYGRKAARAALGRGEKDTAREILEATRAVDARQGWVAFLREDWRLLAALARSGEEEATIARRIEHLDSLVRPCAE